MFERIIHLRFSSPEYLVLLAAVPLVIWMGRASIAGLGARRARAALVVRLAVLAALCAALSGAQIVRIRDDTAVAFVVDKSLSIPKDVQDSLMDQVAAWQTSDTRRAEDRVALVTFGGNGAIDQPFTRDNLDTVTSYALVDPQHTNIAAGIRTAIAAMPQAGRRRIVLITDGNENDGAASSEAASAKSAGVRIDCLPVHYEYPKEVMVEKVIAPAEVAPGKTIRLRVVVRSTGTAKGRLRIMANGVLVASEDVTLKTGINVFSMEKVLAEAGVYDFEASVECKDDTLYQNNRATAFSVVRGPKKVLVVEGTPGDGTVLADALKQEKVAVDLAGPSTLPEAVAVLSRYDTIVLANVAAFDLPESEINLLAAAVKDYGLGLVMVGGPDSFGAGGWRGTAIEEAMPVNMDVKDRQIVPTGALVIINHTCEFPDGNRWGIDISKAALNTLGRYDEFGLLYYSSMGGEQWLVNLQPVTNRGAIKAQIERMQAGDMPSFDATLKMARAALSKSTAAVKHIVIISDGDPAPPPTAFLQKIVDDGITVSTVAIFPHGQMAGAQNMKAIANICKGRFYYPRTAAALPQIFIKEARTVRRGLIFENPFVPTMREMTVPVTGFRDGDFPTLRGYVITTPKALAEIPLLTNKADPLLAHWQYGLGRSVAFTSDANPRWAADWVEWGQFRRFWGQVVEWAERKIQQSDFSTSVSIAGNTAKISVDAIDKDGDFVNFLEFAGTILTPGGRTEELSLEQTAPGHYEGAFDVRDVGTYMPLLRYKDAKGVTRTHMLPVTVPYSAEYGVLSTNEVLLKEISDIAGGEVIGPGADVFRRDFEAAASYTDVWQWLLGAAIILFLLDVAIRRVIVDLAKAAAAVKGVFSWLPGLAAWKPSPARGPAYTARLLSVKKTKAADRLRAGAKFEAAGAEAPEKLDDLIKVQAVSRARAAAEKKPGATPLSEIAREKNEQGDTYTDRLLKAKRRARKERESNE